MKSNPLVKTSRGRVDVSSGSEDDDEPDDEGMV